MDTRQGRVIGREPKNKRERTYTRATISASTQVPDIVHIDAQHIADDSIVIILTQQEFTDEVKRWLRMRPMEQRQLFIDELTACTLRTLELEQ